MFLNHKEFAEIQSLHSGNSCLQGMGRSSCLDQVLEGLAQLHFCYRRNRHCKILKVCLNLQSHKIYLSRMACILLKSFYQFHYCMYLQDI